MANESIRELVEKAAELREMIEALEQMPYRDAAENEHLDICRTLIARLPAIMYESEQVEAMYEQTEE